MKRAVPRLSRPAKIPRTLLRSVALALPLLLLPASGRASAGEISVERLVDARVTIEGVRQEQRDGRPSPLRLTREQVAGLVGRDLDARRRLREESGREIDAAEIQKELDRIVRQTKRPELLRSLFACLGNDPALIAEAIVRPLLVDRELVRRRTRAPGGVAVPDLDAWREMHPAPAPAAVPAAEGIVLDAINTDGSFDPGSWLLREAESPSARYDHSVVWTGSEMIVWGGKQATSVAVETGSRYDPTTDSWKSTRLDATGPSARSGHTAVWTGSEMIVWGGLDNLSKPLGDGALYDPATDSWRPVRSDATHALPTNSPRARWGHTAVWTGSEMIVWGGYGCLDDAASCTLGPLGDGAAYRVSNDGWNATGSTGAPSARWNATAVFTGDRMIVWGGDAASGWAGSGAWLRYDNTTGTWKNWTTINTTGMPFGRSKHRAVWTGSVMLVWGGYGCTNAGCTTNGYLNTGGRFDPLNGASGSWAPTTTTGAPSARSDFAAAWTGSSLMVFGGQTASGEASNGSVYTFDGATESWSAIATPPAGSGITDAGRAHQSGVWIGNELVQWGGCQSCTNPASLTPLGSGMRYDWLESSSTAWKKLAQDTSAPYDRSGHTTLWTGSQMIVAYGASITTGSPIADPLLVVGIYDPLFDSWKLGNPGGSPIAGGRIGHTAVWTGSYMLVWGGYDQAHGYQSVAGFYDPVLDQWALPSVSGAIPPGREGHTAVWDPVGQRMIVWGGRVCTNPSACTQYSYLSSGGVLQSDGAGGWVWSVTSPVSAPSARDEHVAVWDPTHQAMIVWGGRYSPDNVACNYLVDGAIYDPSGSGSWTALNPIGAPAGRQDTTAVWDDTDQAMIVWGGRSCVDMTCTATTSLDSGGQYHLSGGGSWSATSLTGAPSPRSNHTAVWNGREMMVWGGTVGQGPGTGGLYRPSTDTWRNLPATISTPSARGEHGAVWTGREMIVWGGKSTASRTGGLFYPDTPPSARPTIGGGSSATIVLGGTVDSVTLGHSLTTAWWDDVENGALWTPGSSEWSLVYAQNCSGLSDYASPTHAWRFGSTTTCNYSGGSSATPIYLTLATPVAAEADARLEFRYVLQLGRAIDRSHADLADLEVSTDGSTWTVVAVNEGRSSSYPLAVPMLDTTLAWRAVSIPLAKFLTLPVATLHVRFGLQRNSASADGPRGVTLGWIVDDIGIGRPAGDGSIPGGTLRSSDGSTAIVPFGSHDQWDRASFEWDFDGDGVADNTDTSTPVSTLSETALADFGLDTPGSHLLTLKVKDREHSTASGTVTLDVVDGIAPTVTVLSPNGGESWPAQSSQVVTWSASDNDALSGFDLYHVVEDLYLPSTSLPVTLADLASTDFFFDVPTPFTVRDVSLDVEIDWPASEPSVTIELTNCNPDCSSGTSVLLNSGSNPRSSFTSISGNYDRTLATAGSLSVFDGQTSGSQWRLRITDLNAGNQPTVSRLRLFLASERTLLASLSDGSARSWTWNPLPSTSTVRNRIEVTAKDRRSPVPNSTTDDSDSTFYVTSSRSDQVKTLVAWNRSRTEALYGAARTDALEAKLLELVAHPKVDGVLLDVSSGSGIPALYAAWDGTAWNDSSTADNAANVAAANAIAAAIRTYLFSQVSASYTNLETLVLVGGDRLVPFFRFDDTTSRYPETNYVSELQAAGFLGGPSNTAFCQATRSATAAALCANDYFSDTPYAASTTKPVDGSSLTWYLPDIAVGRLVETPDQVIDLVDTFLTQNGVTVVDDATTSGYDFLTDGGDAVYTLLSGALDPGSTTVHRLSQAVSAWTDDELKDRLFGLTVPRSDLTIIAGHADHRAEGAPAAGAAGILTTLEMDAGTASNEGGIVLGTGCHSGLSVTADGGASDDTSAGFQLDLPELFAKKRFPVFIGNGGYGWALQDGVGLGEMLVLLTAREVVDAGQISMGEALRLAKQDYFLRQDRLDAYDHKVLHESILYGIPNYEARVLRAPAAAGTTGWGGAPGLDRTTRQARERSGPRVPGKPWLGDPSWSELDLGGGRRLRKSSAISPDGGSTGLRVLEFEYQAYQAGQNTDDKPPAGTTTWGASTSYGAAATVLPTVSTGFYYQATSGGTSSATEPAWPTTAGGSVVDGSVTWTAFATTDDWEEAYREYDEPGVGTFFTLDGLASDNPGMPIQPMISFDSKLFGTKQHGVLFRGGEFVQPPRINPADAAACTDNLSVVHRCFDPVIGNPVTNATAAEGPAPTPFITFNRPTPFITFNRPTSNGFDEASLDSNSDPVRFDTLNAPMGETIRRGVKEPTPGNRQEIFAEWLYRTRQFTQYYSTSTDWTPPVVGSPTGDCSSEEAGLDCYSTLSGLTIDFDVPVTEESSAGIFKVYVTYESDVDSGFKGSWSSLELAGNGSGHYTGALAVTRSTTYFVQAVDWSGNVGTVFVTGNDLDAAGNPIGSEYRLPRVFSVTLPDGDGDGLPDAYEDLYPCLDKLVAGASADPDSDGLSNFEEFQLGTNPCRGDTDGGGDNDGSEQHHGRQPGSASDDLLLTIGVSKSGSDYTVSWPTGSGSNSQIDGPYFVYRSSTPFFAPPAASGAPIPTGTTTWIDSSPACDPVCYYRVWNAELDSPPPTVDAVVPSTGTAGTSIAVYGTDFVSGATVKFCGIAATNVTFVNSSLIRCKAPTGPPIGGCTVTVTNPNGQDGALASGFTYQ